MEAPEPWKPRLNSPRCRLKRNCCFISCRVRKSLRHCADLNRDELESRLNGDNTELNVQHLKSLYKTN